MKIKSLKLPFTKKSALLVCFFAAMFVFASFTKEDRYKVREWKKSLNKNSKGADKLSNETSDFKLLSQLFNGATNNYSSINNISQQVSLNSDNVKSEIVNHVIAEKAPVVNSTNYSAVETEGTIGAFSDDEEDRLKDNFFTINIPRLDQEPSRVFLEYELFGLAFHQSVPRSINHQLSLGGEIVVPSAEWRHQKEELNPTIIKEGLNTILFTSPSSGVKYKIKNLKIVYEKIKTGIKDLGISSLMSGDILYVKGFSNNSASINNIYIPLQKGEFEKVVTLSESEKASGKYAVTKDGITEYYKIPTDIKSYKVVNNSVFNSQSFHLSKDQELDVNYEDLSLRAEKESTESAFIDVLKLREKDIPAASNGLKNVTANNSAYRISLKSGQLTKKVKISIPYDEKKIGLSSPKEIKVFSFDYERKQWKMEPSTVVDQQTKRVTFESSGEGDYINGVISVPESPQTNASSPTSMSGMKAGDPTAGMQFVTPPTASQTGDAAMSYPVVIPSGRNGLQPNLSITYNSGKGNGWMGEGWDINGISSIDLDTRWGAPSFDPAGESELYSIDGQMLVYEDNYLPQRHSINTNGISTAMQPRNSTGHKSFYLRKNHDFSKIERYGTNPSDYRWVITSTNGIKSYYGGDESAVDSQSVLRAVSGQIIKWGIYKVEDTYRNNIKYYYDNIALGAQSTENANLSGGRIFNIHSIYYTGKDGNNGGYSIVFEKEASILRKDLLINAKQGAKQVNPHRLKMIKIYDNLGFSSTQYFKSYQFWYTDGEFNKSLLTKFWVAEQDHYFNTYELNYHNEIRSGGTPLPLYGPDTSVSTFQPDSSLFELPPGHNPAKINTTYTKEEGAAFRISIMLDFLTFTQNPYGNIILYSPIRSSSHAKARGAQQLVDFNGDGIPDILYKKNDGLYIRPGKLSSTGTLGGFGIERMVKNLQSNFAYTDTKSKSRGKDFGGSISFLSWSIFANTSNINTTSKSTTSTYLIDANSDGIMDVVDGKDVWFNRIDNGTPTFTKFSESTENMVIKANPVAPDPQDVLPKDDVIKVWVAPRDGYIRFHDEISIENVNGANAVYSVEIPSGQTAYSKPIRIYLTKILAGGAPQTIDIRRYNDYFSQIQAMPPLNVNNHLGVNNPDMLYIKSGEKVFIRLHQNEDENYKVFSNPDIFYVDSVGTDLNFSEIYNVDGFNVNNESYSTNFLLNNYESGLKLDHYGNVVVNVPQINFSRLNDEVKIRVLLQNLITNQTTQLSSQTFGQSTAPVTIPAYTLNASISDPSVLMFLVESTSHIDYKNTGLNNITVNYLTGGNNYLLNLVPKYNSTYITDHKPKINLLSYTSNFPSGTKTYTIQINKNIPLSQFNNLPDCTFTYVIKKGGQVLGKRKVFIVHTNNVTSLYEMDLGTNQMISGINGIPVYTMDLTSQLIPRGDGLSVQVFLEKSYDRQAYGILKSFFLQKAFNIYYDNDVLLTAVPESSIHSEDMNPLTKIYKNWGQFLHRDIFDSKCVLDAQCDEYGVLVRYSPPVMNINTASCNHLTDPDQIQACVAQNSSLVMPDSLFPLTTYKVGQTEKWKGGGPEQYSSADAFKDDEFSTGVFTNLPLDYDPANSEDLTNVGPDSPMTIMKAADKIYLSNSKTKSYSGGASGNLGFGASLGYSESSLVNPEGSVLLQDFSDLNGDGYPDFFSKAKLQLTVPTGGHKAMQGAFVGDYVSISDNYQNAITLGANFNVKSFKTTGSNAKTGLGRGTTAQADNSTAWSPAVGVNSSYNFDSKDYGKAYWMDINGDGLIDRISNASSSGFTTSLNYGNGMLSATNFHNSSTYSSVPIGSAGISFGATLSGLINTLGALGSNFGLDIGIGASKSSSTSEKTFDDVNGDGLTDLLSVSSSELSVSYNLGNKFADPVNLKKQSNTQNINFTEEREDLSGYASIGGHLYIPIGPIPIFPFFFLFNLYIKVGVDASANIGMTISEVKKGLKDMNGDGYNDLIRYEGNDIIVNYSRIGKTNKLKSVTNTVSKQSFEIDYKYTTPDYNDPNARLVLGEVKILNPDVFSPTYTESTIDKDIITTFAYENGKYDRREREFLGFEKVTTNQFSEGNTLYRKNVDIFYNKSYHTAGLLNTSESLSGNDVTLSKMQNEYKLYKFNSGITQLVATDPNDFESFDAGGREGRRMATVLPTKVISSQYETNGVIESSKVMTYNVVGLLKNYLYTSPTLTYNSEIAYHQGLGNNMISVPQSIDVYAGTSPGGPALRHRETSVNSNGDVSQVKVKLDNSQFAITDFTYNNYGNLVTVLYPYNDTYARYRLDYEYDTIHNKYVTQTTNAFYETSTAEYDSRFDLPTKTTDIAGNSIEYSYDGNGRLFKVLGPREANLPPTNNFGRYTILYDYREVPKTPGSNVILYRVNTKHYNEDDPENPVETISFSDGLGRMVQTKKDIEHVGVERMSISGITNYDLFGRAIKQFHPSSENKTTTPFDPQNQNNYLVLTSQQPQFSWTEYDLKDRIIKAVDEDNVDTNFEYDIENGLFKTKTTIPSVSQHNDMFANAEGKTVKSINYLNNQPLITSFEYNTTGELLSSTDPEGYYTSYTYDMGGRTLVVAHPDRGKTIFKYDTAGNLTRKYTNNITANPDYTSAPFISYTYNINRLINIHFPDLPNGTNPNNVQYIYGDPGMGNNTGKLVYKSDATGYTSYEYGILGEVINENRTIYGNYLQPMYFNTNYRYDSWNRIKQLTYPDGEILNYHYDFGGNLKKVDNDSGYEYISNVKYDEYEQRTNISYGNTTKSNFSYYYTSRRLSGHSLSTNNPSAPHGLLANQYSYDGAGNIIRLENFADVSPNQMGGVYWFDYQYDELGRLAGTKGQFRIKIFRDETTPPEPGWSPYSVSNSTIDLQMVYNDTGGISHKSQKHVQDLVINPTNTYENGYKYDKHKVTEITDTSTGFVTQFNYDTNGNATEEYDMNGSKMMYWDEMDRMRAFYSDQSGVYQYYTYDDGGERTIKYNLSGGSQLYQNGTLVDPGSLSLNDYKIYASPQIVVSSDGRYTKHYFEGSTRFASRIVDGTDIFMNSTVRGNSTKKEDKSKDAELDFKSYLDKAGLADKVSVELENLASKNGQSRLYYLHGDHLGTANYVTDEYGETTQFFLNLPFGETMAEQMTGIYDNPYKFNAKELDQETGFYYYGARYYNPKWSVWYGVDPLAEKMPNWSPFSYAFDNPVRYTDPEGMAPTDSGPGPKWNHYSAIGIRGYSQIYFQSKTNPDPWTINTFFGGVDLQNPTATNAHILHVGYEDFMFSSHKQMAIYASAIDWNHFDKTHQVKFNSTSIYQGKEYKIGDRPVTLTEVRNNVAAIQELSCNCGAVLMGAVGAATSRYSTVNEVLDNPNLLKNQSPANFSSNVELPSNWKVETLKRGSNRGGGYKATEYNSKGNPTGTYIRYNPGSKYGRKGGDPYWRVSNGSVKSDPIKGK
ncbi:RHS repeat-associated core domain-containing protein [Chryseobacterium chendengshani]|uniref:RHS repeat-associated core domain-containing protein n=1 Tax=Chryseobacterium sp. LJ756 TaxID=2864113 RepID=UPI001C641727|nr:SpvB/TcaC N-terminal domain-containing protein [Chryseobacterium sp. LJ756]MBW7674128.1 hypothetical protein [Chryseobacterium sp. LJ756]